MKTEWPTNDEDGNVPEPDFTFEELMTPSAWTSKECFFQGPHKDCSTPNTCDCVCHKIPPK